MGGHGARTDNDPVRATATGAPTRTPKASRIGWPSMSREVDDGLQAYTVRLELVDEPGELLRALEPISDNRGNLLSIFHERGNITPRGHIPVEVDLECPPERFPVIVESLREAGVNVIQAGAERYAEEVTVILVGHLIQTDRSDTISRIEGDDGTRVVDFSLSAAAGMDEQSSARIRLATEAGGVEDALASCRAVGAEKDLDVIEPATPEGDG